MRDVPLVVDLDGTLLRTDTLHESLLVLARTSPGLVPRLPVWAVRDGRAGFKRQVADRTDLDVGGLPLNDEFVEWLREERSAGRRVILATAADESLATRVAERLGVFDEVLASNGSLNLAGSHKAAALVERFGERGFDYAGNARADVEVWRHARRAIVVNPDRGVAKRVPDGVEVEAGFDSPTRGVGTWIRVLRSHQWLKNVLLVIPLIAAHTVPSPAVALDLLLALLAMSFCASSVYIVNDLVDLENDRRHPRKQRRPFASGRVPVRVGVALAPALFALSLWLAFLVNTQFLGWLLVYVVTTTAYSFGLKRVAILDCILLALLYTLRVVAGAAATDTPLSFWLLAMCVFLFLSLAFVKRYAELHAVGRAVGAVPTSGRLHGRGYSAVDAPVVQSFGVASGFAAALVLALYLDSDGVRVLYAIPELLWGTVPILVYWMSWIWLKANRGEMHDDPLLFAVRDRTSLALGAVFGAVFVASALAPPL